MVQRQYFFSVSQHKSMRAIDPQDVTQGLDWQDLCRGPLDIATYKR